MKKQEVTDPRVIAAVEKAMLEAVQRQRFGDTPLNLKKIAKDLLDKHGNDTRSKKGS